MTVTARFQVRTPLMRRTVESIDEIGAGTELSIEEFTMTPSHGAVIIARAAGQTPELDDALRRDPTVKEYQKLSNGASDALYRIHPNRLGVESALHDPRVEAGALFVGARWDGDGWRTRMIFPHRKAVESFVDHGSRCQGVEIELTALVENDTPRGHEHELTEAQLEVLELSLERGYFDVPRETTLKELGQEMGVSDSAASQRIRRAMKRLVADTVRPDS